MIVDFKQHRTSVDISYVTDKLDIDVVSVPLTNGYYNYIECDEFDEEKLPNKTSLYGKHIKRDPSNKFKNHNINEFFNVELKETHPHIHEMVSKLKIPKPFSIDIETEITDEFGYSNAEKVENKILSISITDTNLTTLILQLENPNKPQISDEDLTAISNFVNTALNITDESKMITFQVRQFSSEFEMLNTFIELMQKYFHAQIGWNVELFDFPWIFNRCTKLGVDITKASPKGTVTVRKVPARKFDKKAKVAKKIVDKITGKITVIEPEKEEVEMVTKSVPDHRLLIDYMNFFKSSLQYKSMDSHSLSNVSKVLLGLDKVQYVGNLRTLYTKDPNKFVAYAILDTVLVMMLHLKTNLYNQNFYESYFNVIPYNSIAQNAISESLVYNELALRGKFLLDTEHTGHKKRPFKGAYVKKPTRKLCSAVAGYDFKSLYPNSIITNGLSPELRVDRLVLKSEPGDLNIVFANQGEENKWKKYHATGHVITVNGYIYKRNSDGTDGLFVAIEKKLLAQRSMFRVCTNDIYLNLSPKIEQLISQKRKELENGN